MPKITLNIDDQLLARAEELGRAHQLTAEQMLQRLLRVLSRPELKPEELSPITRSVVGVLKPPMSDEEVKQAIDEYRMEKYGT